MSRYFTKDHEWIDAESGAVGITDYAQSQLGDITYVELPAQGQAVKQGDTVSVVESVKAASDIYSPASGTVTEVNGELEGAPELVNSDAEEGGWLYKLSLADAGELGALMDKAAYDDYVAGL